MFQNVNIIVYAAIFLSLIVGITIHEFSHAASARLLGDTTAERLGRLSLNPLVHLDPWGSLMMILSVIMGFGIGWGKPTPVSPWNLRFGRRIGMAIVSLAGPLSNLTLALAAAPLLLLKAVSASPTMVLFVFTFILTNVGLAAFNLLPIPILDGYHILTGVIAAVPGRIASRAVYQLDRLEAFGPQILLALILLGALVPQFSLFYVLDPFRRALGHLVFGVWGMTVPGL